MKYLKKKGNKMKKDEKKLREFVLACIENYCWWYSGGKDTGIGKEWLANDECIFTDLNGKDFNLN
tara:strand:+ start:119 stop:313 length:195 start_codon:yes stop_codon:yes gene_type:complete